MINKTTSRTHTRLRGKAAVLAIVLACSLPLAHLGPAAAQQLPARLIVRSCDTSKFPSVTCSVALIDPQGLTITGVPKDAFEVTEGSTALTISTMAEAPGPDASTSSMLVVDMSGSLSGKYVADLRAAVEASLKDKPINELVGLIALTGKIETPASADKITLDPLRESTFSKDANDAVINKLRGLNAQTSTPLHDGLIKAILMARKQPFGARAIIVMTDGFDTRSTAANIDDVVALARQEGLPIYTFGFGAIKDVDKLKRLSVTSGGAYAAATDAATTAAAYRAIQDRLKSQYALSFVLPGDNKGERKFVFNAKLTDRKVDSGETTFKPEAPEVPVIESIKFTSDGQEQKATSLPSGTITVEPMVFAKAVSKVEYQLDGGEIVVSYQQPFTYTLRTSSLDASAAHELAVKVFGAEGRADLISQQKVALTIAGGTVSVPTTAGASPTDTASAATTTTSTQASATVAAPTAAVTSEPTLIDTFLGNPVLLAALAVGILALLALAFMIVASAARRRRAQQAGPPTDVLSSPFTTSSAYPSTFGTGSSTGTGTGTSGFDTGGIGSSTQIFGAPAEDRTQIFVDANDNQKTQVLQTAKAMLEVLSGPTKGDKLPIGVLGKTSIVIGRDADPLVGDLKLQSTYVSRKHAEIHIEGDDLYLVDLGSSSGTRLNGERVTPNEKHKIELGNEINFADVKVKVLGPD